LRRPAPTCRRIDPRSAAPNTTRESCRLDPQFAESWATLTVLGQTGDPTPRRRAGGASARQDAGALQLAPSLPGTRR
jgi:hypothetical protein